jgi:hypothetical protein
VWLKCTGNSSMCFFKLQMRVQSQLGIFVKSFCSFFCEKFLQDIDFIESMTWGDQGNAESDITWYWSPGKRKEGSSSLRKSKSEQRNFRIVSTTREFSISLRKGTIRETKANKIRECHIFWLLKSFCFLNDVALFYMHTIYRTKCTRKSRDMLKIICN